MTRTAPNSVKVFFSYSHKDEEYLDELKTNLAGLRWQGLIEEWHDREILPGQEWDKVIDENLKTSEIILLLVTAPFINSRYIYEKEMKWALGRHERGEARVIPIIVRPTDWEWAPFGKLQALPKNAEPITTWPNQDEAWLDVVRGIRKAVEELTSKSNAREQEAASPQQTRRGAEPTEQVGGREEEDSQAFAPQPHQRHGSIEPSNQLTSTRSDSETSYDKGEELFHQRRYEEALEAYDRAISIDPDYVDAWSRKGHTLVVLERYEEALEAFERAISINSDSIDAWDGKCAALMGQGLYEEALEALERAKSINPDRPPYLFNYNYMRGWALDELGHYEEALEAFERAISIRPDDDSPWIFKGLVLDKMGRHDEAQEAWDKADELRSR